MVRLIMLFPGALSIHLSLRTIDFNRLGFNRMIPHKTKRGSAALAKLKIYEGVHTPYNRKVIPDALKVLRLTAGQSYCLLGRLSSEVGWNHYDTIKRNDMVEYFGEQLSGSAFTANG